MKDGSTTDLDFQLALAPRIEIPVLRPIMTLSELAAIVEVYEWQKKHQPDDQ